MRTQNRTFLLNNSEINSNSVKFTRKKNHHKTTTNGNV